MIFKLNVTPIPSSLHLKIEVKNVIHNNFVDIQNFSPHFQLNFLDYFKENQQTNKKEWRLELANPQISSLHLKVDF